MRPSLLVVFLAATFVLPVLAEVHTVAPDGSGDFPTIQAAIDAALDGDEILLIDGTFTGPGNRVIDFLGKAIVVRSESGQAGQCVVDLESHRGFFFKSGEGPGSVLADVTVENAHIALVELDGSSPTIRNVVLRGFVWHGAVRGWDSSPLLEDVTIGDGHGLAIALDGGAPVLTGCVLEASTLTHSRGLVSFFETDVVVEDLRVIGPGDFHRNVIRLCGGTGTFRDCEFRETVTTAIDVAGSGTSVLVEDCDFVHNRMGVAGGPGTDLTVRDSRFEQQLEYAIEASGSALIQGCTVIRGGRGIHARGPTEIEDGEVRGTRGNGLRWVGASGVARRTLVSGNLHNGVWVSFGGDLTLEDCTIATNGPHESRRGLRIEGDSNVHLARTIVWGNCASEADVRVESGSALSLDCVNLDLSRVDGEGVVGTVGELIESDPLFCAPLDCLKVNSEVGIYTLRASSPALKQDCGVMGGLGEGCFIATEPATWGKIKSRYR